MHRLKKLFSLGAPDVKRVDGTTNFEGIKEARQQGETYINYGRRLCGICQCKCCGVATISTTHI